MNKMYNPKEMAEKAKAEMEARREQERAQRIETKKRAKESGADIKKDSASVKLAEARRRDAEKYGDELTE
jgi:YidC/Oxa1 family membrane protein insertase